MTSQCRQSRKGTRILDLYMAGKTVCFSIHDRFRVPKGIFVNLGKDPNLHFSNSERDILRRWIARRYVRSAFPDAFNVRLKQNNKFQELLKSDLVRNVSGIWIDVADSELPDTSSYQIRVIVGLENHVGTELQDKLEEAFDAAFPTGEGVTITDIQVLTYDDITLRHLLTFRRLDRDSLSLHGDMSSAILPAGVDTC